MFFLLGGAIFGGLTLWVLLRSPPPAEPPVIHLIHTLPEDQSFAGHAHPLAVSPDGSRIAYAARSGTTSHIYVRNLNELGVRLLAGTEGAASPFFSPDGQWIGFFSQAKLKKISVTGGGAITLCDVPSWIGSNAGGGASWGKDRFITYATGRPGLVRVSEDGGPIETLVPGPGVIEVSGWPHLLPDKNNLLFTYATPEGSRLELLRLQTGERHVLLPGGAGALQARTIPTGHIVYAQSGELFAVPFDEARLEVGTPTSILEGIYSVHNYGWGRTGYFALSDNGTLAYVAGPSIEKRELVWVDRKGNVTRAMDETDAYSQPRISPDGSRVAVTVTRTQMDIWVCDLERGTRTRITTQGINELPVWTPDGTRLTFLSNFDVHWTRADGSGEMEPLVALEKAGSRPSSWSLDGRWLAFTTIGASRLFDVYVLSLEGDQKAVPVLTSEFNTYTPMFSPDGRWLAYVSDESGRAEVYVQPFPGGGSRHLISTGGGREPLWSRDRREIFYRSGDKMMVVNVTTNPDFNASTPRVLFEGKHLLNDYDVSPDGQRFLMVRSQEESEPKQIHIVFNWLEEVKRLVPEN